MTTVNADALEALRDAWRHRWPDALALWSRFTRLSEPRWCLTSADAAREGLSESFAMIRLHDQAVVVSLLLIDHYGLHDYALEVLGHEVGHHVLCPADLSDQGRMVARMRWALPGKEHLAGFLANLYADLLINDRLQRSSGLRLSGIFEKLGGGSADPMWTLYMRMYEILWGLSRETLASGQVDSRMEGDAALGARLVRAFGRRWLDGSGRFAALCFPYLVDDDGRGIRELLKVWRDAEAGAGGHVPHGLTEIEPGEREGAIHPAFDPDLSGVDDEAEDAEKSGEPVDAAAPVTGHGQFREPFEYGAVLRALGLKLSDHDVAVRYYRERASAHLVPFPERDVPQSSEPLPEGLEPWDIGSPLESADWTESVLRSPVVIPGATTVQRVWGTSEGSQPQRQPIDLDLYVDSSASMPNPQHVVSYLALAGAIVALSALRAGASVQATLWSGAGQFETTDGFVRDETAILRTLTGYIGGATAFPIHILRDTYRSRTAADRPVHILVISDDGVTTMYDADEMGASGWDVAAMALERARGGGTQVLNMAEPTEPAAIWMRAKAMGWSVNLVSTWEQLVDFARAFSRLSYAP